MLNKIFLPAFIFAVSIFAITLLYKGSFEGFNWSYFFLFLLVLILSQIINQKRKNK